MRKGPGLTVLSPGECDLCVIAGMGGNLICDILSGSPEVAGSIERFVLSPKTCEYDLRKYLWENDYDISSETFITEGDHSYVVMNVSHRKDIEPRSPRE